VDLDSLRHPGPGAIGGEAGCPGPLAPAGCRRLACDGAVTRVLVTRQPSHPDRSCGQHGARGHRLRCPEVTDPGGHDHGCGHDLPGGDPGGQGDSGLAERLQTAATRLPPLLGGAPSQPLDLGRTTRVVQPAQRLALAVGDGGCGFPGCARPLAWCEAHHLVALAGRRPHRPGQPHLVVPGPSSGGP
jgi:hypothetical protein